MQKILFDLSWLHQSRGFNGISQDVRFTFAELSKLKTYSLTGLIWGMSPPSFSLHKNKTETIARFLGPHLNDSRESLKKVKQDLTTPQTLARKKLLLQQYITSFLKNQYPVINIDLDQHGEFIWKTLFAFVFSATFREFVMANNFACTDLSALRVKMGEFSLARLCYLDTEEFDFVFFATPQSIRVSKNTQKIVRFYDCIPVLDADTVNLGQNGILGVHRQIINCSHDSIFVCDSDYALDSLSKISNRAVQKARVIPCSIPYMQPTPSSAETLQSICKSRISTLSLPKNFSNNQQICQTWFNNNKIPKYILTVGTIEPRKNQLGIIRAWSRLRQNVAFDDFDIKMIVIGKTGWLYESVLQEMQPHISNGEMLHLQGLTQSELARFYSAASCFVYASFCEGFGIPPVEAMQCLCPVAVSDIPPHRYVCKDAALYFDPFDVHDIEAKIRLLVDNNGVHDLQAQVQRGLKNVQRFSSKVIAQQWQALFHDTRLVKSNKKDV